MDVKFKLTSKQKLFIDADCDEVLYGGAAGGGKSYGQIIDAFLFAMKYPKSKQLILRTTFPELERSLIMVSLEVIPKELYIYNQSKHRMRFKNGSLIEFGYLSSDSAVTMYQSAEYDIIRFDELTHFSEYQYTYMLSRIRGANSFPKQVKSSTNPGSAGHAWVKARFIDTAPPLKKHEDENGRSYIFIPAKVQENRFLMESDPNYIKRLEALGEDEKKALLYGEWDIFKGQYFGEFKRSLHVIEPFEIPASWRRFRSLDYGLDMTACLWYAVDSEGNVYVYRELHEPNLILSEAAAKITALSKGERILYTAASPDLWNRRQDTGFSGVEIMTRSGLSGLMKADDRRVIGWRNVREYLKPENDGAGEKSKLRIFSSCLNLIKNIPLLIHDDKNPEDASDNPHEVTHAPESLRYGLMSRPISAAIKKEIHGTFTKTEREDLGIDRLKAKKRN